jgi:hypothetical protein
MVTNRDRAILGKRPEQVTEHECAAHREWEPATWSYISHSNLPIFVRLRLSCCAESVATTRLDNGQSENYSAPELSWGKRDSTKCGRAQRSPRPVPEPRDQALQGRADYFQIAALTPGNSLTPSASCQRLHMPRITTRVCRLFWFPCKPLKRHVGETRPLPANHSRWSLVNK